MEDSTTKSSADEPTPADEPGRMPAEIVFRPLRSPNVFEETFGRLSQAVRLGVVPVGERFPTERELHAHLKVSRITIREALRALEQAGFVEIRRGRNGGAYVLQREAPSAKRSKAERMPLTELDSALDFRRAVDTTIAELAAERREDDQLEQVAVLLEEAERASPSTFRAVDSRFHLAVAAMAHSPRLAAAAADVRLQHGEIVADLASLTEEAVRHTNDQHRALFEAIQAGDAVTARAVTVDHVEATAAIIRALYPA